MGKFEKRIRNKVKSEVDDFDAWFDKNQERFKEESVQETKCTELVARRNQRVLLGVIGVLLILFVGLLTLFIIQSEQSKKFTFFAEDDLIARDITTIDTNELKDRDEFLSQMTINTGTVTRHVKSGEVVFTQLSGEVEYSDYYVCEMQIVYDKRYRFFAENRYLNLPNKISGKNGTLSYRAEGVSDIGLQRYTVVVTLSEATVYMDMQCFEESIGDFAEKCFAIKEG